MKRLAFLLLLLGAALAWAAPAPTPRPQRVQRNTGIEGDWVLYFGSPPRIYDVRLFSDGHYLCRGQGETAWSFVGRWEMQGGRVYVWEWGAGTPVSLMGPKPYPDWEATPHGPRRASEGTNYTVSHLLVRPD